MKTLFTFFLTAFLGFSFWVYEINSGVNLRKGPDNNKRVLRTVAKGETIAVLSKTNEWWWHVEYEGTQGYIATSFISPSYTKTCWLMVRTYPYHVAGLMLFIGVLILRGRKKAAKGKKKSKARKK
ncbi:MAG: SH3 domain-containing protein [Marinoscillum sp.]